MTVFLQIATVTDIANLYKLATAAGVPFAIVIAMWANQKGIWLWHREVESLVKHNNDLQIRVTELEERNKLLDEEKFEWKSAALFGAQSTRKLAQKAKAAKKSDSDA